MSEAGFGNIKKISSYGTSGPQGAKDTAATGGSAPTRGTSSALNDVGITGTSTKSVDTPGRLSYAFGKLGINNTLPQPGATAPSIMESIDLTHPNMNAIMAILTTLQTQLSTGAGKAQIETLKSIDAQILNKIKEVQREIQDRIDEANNMSGFQEFIHDICDNDVLNEISSGLKDVGPYFGVVSGSIVMAALIVAILICPLFIILAPGAIFLFIDGIDQITGNHIFDFVVEVLAKLLVAMGVSEKEAERIAKVITYVVYMVAMLAAVGGSGINPIIAVSISMGRSGQGSEDFDALIDKKQQVEDTIKELKEELVQLLEKRAIIAKKVGEIIAAELAGKSVSGESSQEALEKEINEAAKKATTDEMIYKKLVDETDFSTIDPNVLIASPIGTPTKNAVQSPEMMAIILDIMEKMGIKFIQKEDGSYSCDPKDFISGSRSVRGKKVTEGLIDSMSQNDTANLLSAFLSQVLNSVDLFQTVISKLQNEVREVVQQDQSSHNKNDNYEGERGMI